MIILRTLMLVITSSQVVVSKHEGDLKAVIVLFRHGDRSPTKEYAWPNDRYINNLTLWPDGYGQLNNLGKRRQYQLGQWLRQRYDGFLPARYNPGDIYVRSIDIDRVITSAAYTLAGLYPPSGDQIWNKDIPWQAIPIHTIELEDPIFSYVAPCPKHQRLLEELLNSTELQKFYQDHAEFIKNLSGVTGFDVNEIDVRVCYQIFLTIKIYRAYNLRLPNWTEDFLPALESLAVQSYQCVYTRDLARLKVGPFMNYLKDYFNSMKPENNLTEAVNPRFLMLSGHGVSVAHVMNAMLGYPMVVPGFTSSIIWEVKSRPNGTLFVNLYFINSTHFNSIVLPGCEFDCDVDQFVKIFEPITVGVEQWTQECNRD